ERQRARARPHSRRSGRRSGLQGRSQEAQVATGTLAPIAVAVAMTERRIASNRRASAPARKGALTAPRNFPEESMIGAPKAWTLGENSPLSCDQPCRLTLLSSRVSAAGLVKVASVNRLS